MCNVNLSCAHGGINDVRDHVGKDKHKAAKKNQDFNLMLSFSFKSHYITRYALQITMFYDVEK